MTCVATTVPAGWKARAQAPPTQVRDWHAVSIPGQSVGALQPMQAPAASQTRPPPQEVPWGNTGLEGTPATQASVVQALPSLGTSVSSTALVTPPLPSQTSAWQSPGVCVAVGFPAATIAVPHLLSVQTAVMQSLPVAGQSMSLVHSPAIPPVPMPPVPELALALEPPPVPMPPAPPVPMPPVPELEVEVEVEVEVVEDVVDSVDEPVVPRSARRRRGS